MVTITFNGSIDADNVSNVLKALEQSKDKMEALEDRQQQLAQVGYDVQFQTSGDEIVVDITEQTSTP